MIVFNFPKGAFGFPHMTEKEKLLKHKLNIGCGNNKSKGFINIDTAKEVNPDMVVDIKVGLPFPDNHFDYIYSSHALEHIEPSKWNFVLNEIGRVAKNGCILELDLPFDNISSRCNLDHYRSFNWSSFDSITTEGDIERNYYYPFSLEWVNPKPHKLIRMFGNLFPMFVWSINFKFRVVK